MQIFLIAIQLFQTRHHGLPAILPDNVFIYITSILGNGGNGNSVDIMFQYTDVMPTSTVIPPMITGTVKLESGDLFFPDSTRGFIMKDLNGICWQFRVNTDGSLSSVEVVCPE